MARTRSMSAIAASSNREEFRAVDDAGGKGTDGGKRDRPVLTRQLSRMEAGRQSPPPSGSSKQTNQTYTVLACVLAAVALIIAGRLFSSLCRLCRPLRVQGTSSSGILSKVWAAHTSCSCCPLVSSCASFSFLLCISFDLALSSSLALTSLNSSGTFQKRQGPSSLVSNATQMEATSSICCCLETLNDSTREWNHHERSCWMSVQGCGPPWRVRSCSALRSWSPCSRMLLFGSPPAGRLCDSRSRAVLLVVPCAPARLCHPKLFLLHARLLFSFPSRVASLRQVSRSSGHLLTSDKFLQDDDGLRQPVLFGSVDASLSDDPSLVPKHLLTASADSPVAGYHTLMMTSSRHLLLHLMLVLAVCRRNAHRCFSCQSPSR
eukprot:760977-Hanusia_phi.AAC.2